MAIKDETAKETIDRQEEEIRNLYDRIDDLEFEAKAYKLSPISENSVVSRYEFCNPQQGFLHHEALSFRDHRGYDQTALLAWVQGSVERAFMGNALGDRIEEIKQSGGNLPAQRRVNVPCANLQPFNPGDSLEVLIRILPTKAAPKTEDV